MTDNVRQIVEIKWIDSSAVSSGVWAGKEDVQDWKPDTCISVGFVVADKDEYITLAAHEAQHQYGGEICIPRSAITKITQLYRESKTKPSPPPDRASKTKPSPPPDG